MRRTYDIQGQQISAWLPFNFFLFTVKHDFKSYRINQQDSFVIYPYYYLKTICDYIMLLYYALGIFSEF